MKLKRLVAAAAAVLCALIALPWAGAAAADGGAVRKELTAVEMTRLMGNGINLGNTMEAYGHLTPGVGQDPAVYETLWGMPVTTQAMVDGMKAAGFDSLRIPVAWTNAMNFESGDYTIDPAYLDRVEEIIRYALNNDMYVIVNDHWDGSWWGMFGSATPAVREQAMEMYVSMWTQIARRYAQYGDHLIFESGNEELGDRLNDTDIAKDSGALSEDERYATANRINQTFVDTIRAAGGNNADRFLLIAGYNTDIEHTCDSRFVMPADTAQNKLMVSVHYYTPWNYCGTSSVTRWGDVDDYEEQNRLLEKMSAFTEQGYGVVIGEYAVLLEDGAQKENLWDYYNNFLNNCDLYGFCPMLWDTNSLYSRADCRIVDEEVAELYRSRSFAAQSSLTGRQIADSARAQMDAALAAAPATLDETVDLSTLDKPMAWIMFNSQDWSVTYSAGDTYDPTAKSDGVAAADVEITGPGTYTVALDFTGTAGGCAYGTAFSALAVSGGELLYPDYVIDIREIRVNGEPYAMTARPYTTSDDGKCTRANLYNAWVSELPADARAPGGDLTGASAAVVDGDALGEIKTLSVTFTYMPQDPAPADHLAAGWHDLTAWGREGFGSIFS